jgi:hypothetical protein
MTYCCSHSSNRPPTDLATHYRLPINHPSRLNRQYQQHQITTSDRILTAQPIAAHEYTSHHQAHLTPEATTQTAVSHQKSRSPQQSKQNGPLRSLNLFPTSHSPARLPLARNNAGLLGNLHDNIRPIPDNEFRQNGQSAEHAGVRDALVSFPSRNANQQHTRRSSNNTK